MRKYFKSFQNTFSRKIYLINILYRFSVIILALFLGFNFIQCNSEKTSQENSPIATTKYGKVKGYVDNNIDVFKGIPYGDNTANRRFQAPVPPVPWNDIKDATEFGPVAPQGPIGKSNFYPMPKEGTKMSEDCLHLNVWTPGLRDGKQRPVMVWFHGGGYSSWSCNIDLYDGVNLCRKGDVVVVTVNHRLNGFGYLYLGELGGKEFAESGNAGMLDLVLALKWIKENISEFGGDPDNVTIFGESGGGAKCATLMAMPAARGLFNKVITESGQQLTGRTKVHATETALNILKALNISPGKIDEIKTIPMEKLNEAIQGNSFAPVTDGIVLPRDPFSPDASPLSADIPMIMGNNHDETTLLIGARDTSTFNLSWKQLPAKISQHVKQFIGNLDPKMIIKKYRNWYPDYSPSDIFFAVTTAARSWKGMVIESERRAEQNGAPTYVFQLNWKSPVSGGKWKASHTMDVPLVFNNIEYGKTMTGIGPEAQKMADIMSESWLAFARNGNPDTPNIPHWPRFDLKNRATMVFDLQSKVENDPRGNERKLFAPVIYIQPGT
jgi:para-nitrobenzyl esterase